MPSLAPSSAVSHLSILLLRMPEQAVRQRLAVVASSIPCFSRWLACMQCPGAWYRFILGPPWNVIEALLT